MNHCVSASRREFAYFLTASGSHGLNDRTAVQISEGSWHLTGLGPAAVRKGSAFPAHLARFLFLRAAGRLCLPAARRRFRGGFPRRKGEAFPHSKRRSRRSPFNGLTVIWTRLTSFCPRRASRERECQRSGGEPRMGRHRGIVERCPDAAPTGADES